MGERLLCKQEVIGSIPFTSTTMRHAHCGEPRQRCKAPPGAARCRERHQPRDGRQPLDREKTALPLGASSRAIDL